MLLIDSKQQNVLNDCLTASMIKCFLNNLNAVRDSRELKHQAFLLSRKPTGTKLSADVAFLNTSCGPCIMIVTRLTSYFLTTVLVYQNCKVFFTRASCGTRVIILASLLFIFPFVTQNAV